MSDEKDIQDPVSKLLPSPESGPGKVLNLLGGPGGPESLKQAEEMGNWGDPFSSSPTSWDAIGLAATPALGDKGWLHGEEAINDPLSRNIGRGIGTAIAGGEIASLAGGAGGAAGGGAAGTGATAGGGGASALTGGAEADTIGTTAATGASSDTALGGGLQLSSTPAAEGMGGAAGLVAPAGTTFAGGATETGVGAGGAISGLDTSGFTGTAPVDSGGGTSPVPVAASDTQLGGGLQLTDTPALPDMGGAAGFTSPSDAGMSFGSSAGGSDFVGSDWASGMPGTDTSGLGYSTDTGAPVSDATRVDTTDVTKQPIKLGENIPGGVKGAGSALLKYGPLAYGGINAYQQRQQAKKYANELKDIGAPQRAEGQALLAQYQAGQINPADQYQIDQWEQSSVAQARAYYAKAGLSDSSMAKNAEAEIHSKAAAMKETALQNILNEGLNTLNITDQYQAAAVKAEMSGDQAAAQQALLFLNAYGSWLRAQPNLSSGTTTPAPTAPQGGPG